MSLIVKTFYNVRCDRCKDEYESSNYFYNGDPTEADAEARAVYDGWHKIGDKHYCPKCAIKNEQDIYVPAPPIPKELLMAKRVLTYMSGVGTAAELTEDHSNFFLVKHVGAESNYEILSASEKTVLRGIIGRDFDVDYFKETNSALGQKSMILKITVPKYESEFL